MDRRHFLALTGAAGVATAAGVAGVNVTGASAATPRVLIGHSDPKDNVDATDSQILHRAANVVREYHVQGTPIPTTALAADILADLQAGRSVIYSIKVPDTTSATAAKCEALAADIANKGYASKVFMSLFHEPYNGDGSGLTATEFIARYQASAPGIRQHGVKCGPIWQMSPILNDGFDYTKYWPGDSICDYLGIDVYARTLGVTVSPLKAIDPLSSFAKSKGKPFGIAECGLNDDDVKNRDAAIAWLKAFERLGSSALFVSYWNQGEFQFTAGDARVVGYQHLYDHFNGA